MTSHGAPTTNRQRALVAALRDALGQANVTDCEGGDADPRTARHVSGRPVGRPLCWVRPATTAACAAAMRIARTHGAPVCPVGDATTFWDGLRVEAAVALDVTALRSPFTIDRARRLAWVGAGCTVRAIDRAARAQGLCLAAYPDASGDTPIGTLVAVGTTAGLGMGRALPIEQVTGATAVLGSGEIVRTGASHALGGSAFMRHGLPDMLGLMTASEGRSALITEIGLSLTPAPHCVQGLVEVRLEHAPEADDLVGILTVARRALDRGSIETFRCELGSAGDEEEARFEVLFRCFSTRSAADAHDEAARLRAELQATLGKAATLETETARARAGELPDYDARFSVPPGQHRARIEGGAFWGAEVAASWGDDLRACLARLLALHRDLRALGPIHRRLGIYPASHSVSVGVQVLGSGGEQPVAELSERVAAALPDLLAAGGVPYRAGNLWHAALGARLATQSATPAALERCLHALDPDRTLPGAVRDAGTPPNTGAGPEAAAMHDDDLFSGRREAARRRLCEAHAGLVARETDGRLLIRAGRARIALVLERPDAPQAHVRGRHLSLGYRIEGKLTPQETTEARTHLLAITQTFARLEAEAEETETPRPGSPQTQTEADAQTARTPERLEVLARRAAGAVRLSHQLLSAPEQLVEVVDRLYRASLGGARLAPIIGLSPCLDLVLRPEAPEAPITAAQTPLTSPCDRCGTAMHCPTSAAPPSASSPPPQVQRPLRPLRHHEPTAAALAALHAIASAFERPIPPLALDAVVALLGARLGVLAMPPTPLELSLKRSDDALLPHLRVVEYSPRSRPGLPTREERGPLRRARLSELAQALGAVEASAWVKLMEGAQPAGLELSFGLDADLASGQVLPQLYAHLEPRERGQMLGALERVLAWSCPDTGEFTAVTALAQGGPSTPERSDIVLIAHAPGPDAPRRTKIYFARRLGSGHEPSGLRPAQPGALSAYAPEYGLCVLSCGARGPRWEKWDFPCLSHFQRAGGLAAAFAEGLPPSERARVEGLLDGRRFAPWPTWLSVGTSASTLYFVAR